MIYFLDPSKCYLLWDRVFINGLEHIEYFCTIDSEDDACGDDMEFGLALAHLVYAQDQIGGVAIADPYQLLAKDTRKRNLGNR